MLAGPKSTIKTMRKAIHYSITALDAAAEIDLDASPEDREVLTQEKSKLEALTGPLAEAAHGLEAYDLGRGLRLQVAVELGDAVLDRGVREANARTKLALRNKSGLGAAHVFGRRVSELTSEKLRLEPGRVTQAAQRLLDLPDFDSRTEMKQDLEQRAKQQENLLQQRDQGERERNQLVSKAVRLVAEGSDALAKAKAALDGQFLRQRAFVSSFFLDVARPRSVRSDNPSEPSPTGDDPQ